MCYYYFMFRCLRTCLTVGRNVLSFVSVRYSYSSFFCFVYLIDVWKKGVVGSSICVPARCLEEMCCDLRGVRKTFPTQTASCSDSCLLLQSVSDSSNAKFYMQTCTYTCVCTTYTDVYVQCCICNFVCTSLYIPFWSTPTLYLSIDCVVYCFSLLQFTVFDVLLYLIWFLFDLLSFITYGSSISNFLFGIHEFTYIVCYVIINIIIYFCLLHCAFLRFESSPYVIIALSFLCWSCPVRSGAAWRCIQTWMDHYECVYAYAVCARCAVPCFFARLPDLWKHCVLIAAAEMCLVVYDVAVLCLCISVFLVYAIAVVAVRLSHVRPTLLYQYLRLNMPTLLYCTKIN